MNYPVLLATDVITEGTGISYSVAYGVAGVLAVLAVAWGETRATLARSIKDGEAQAAKLEAAEKRFSTDIDDVRTKAARALDDARKESEKDRDDLRKGQHVLEVASAKADAVMTEVRSQLAKTDLQMREQTAMLSELLMLERSSARRRKDDAA